MCTLNPSELKEILLIIIGVIFVLYLILLFLGFVNRSVRTLYVAFWIAIFMAFLVPNVFLLEGVMGMHSWNPSILLCHISIIAIAVPIAKSKRLQYKR